MKYKMILEFFFSTLRKIIEGKFVNQLIIEFWPKKHIVHDK